MTKLQKAQELYKLFTHKTNQKSEVYLCLSDEAQNHPNYPTLLNLIYDSNLGTESSYNFVYEALGLLADIADEELGLEGDKLEEYIEERISEMESDIYTSNLTAWLNESINHVACLQEALEELASNASNEINPSTAFNLLAHAQYIAKTEVARNVNDTLDKIITNLTTIK